MLVALARGGMEEQNQDFAAALSHAVNEWQLEEWVKPEPRLRAGIVVPQEDPATAVAEIEARAGNTAFRQIIVSPRTAEPLGRRRYWPIFAAAQAAGLPIGLHPAGASGGYRVDRIGLADLLHAGALFVRDRHAGRAGEPGVRGRVRTLSGPAGLPDRVRASPGCRRCAGAWTSIGSAIAPRCRT